MDRIGKTSIFKCILLLSAALSFLVLTGCGSGLPWKINEHSNTTVYTGDDVKLSIADKSLTNAGCTYLLKNDRDSTIYSSEIFCLQIWFDNKWNGIDAESSFPASMLVLQEKQTAENTVSWKTIYGELPAGRYRLLVPFRSNDNAFSPEYYVAAEFMINITNSY